jgi:hypothetical protein
MFYSNDIKVQVRIKCAGAADCRTETLTWAISEGICDPSDTVAIIGSHCDLPEGWMEVGWLTNHDKAFLKVFGRVAPKLCCVCAECANKILKQQEK